jgi:hypothetical protein
VKRNQTLPNPRHPRNPRRRNKIMGGLENIINIYID